MKIKQITREQGMTYQEVGDIYGLNRDTIFDRIKRYKKDLPAATEKVN